MIENVKKLENNKEWNSTLWFNSLINFSIKTAPKGINSSAMEGQKWQQFKWRCNKLYMFQVFPAIASLI